MIEMSKKHPEPSSWSWSDSGKTGSGGAWQKQTKKSQKGGCDMVAVPAVGVITLLVMVWKRRR